MKAITLILILCPLVIASCVDADDEQPKAYSKAVSDYQPEELREVRTGPDTTRSVSYLSERPWDGWKSSPERVKVTVRVDGSRHTHYFESLPVAYGWLPERYDKYNIVELLVANALTSHDLLDFGDAYFVTSRSVSRSIPVVLAYPTRQDAVLYVDRYPDQYTVVDWNDMDRRLDSWRADYWGNWRGDFGFVRSATVAHLDGSFWDGWYETPDRVLVRANDGGRLTSYYFDSLPVAWSWIDSRPAGFKLADLQIAAADGSLRLLPVREANYLWMPAGSDALPAVLAFATAKEAADYLHRLGDSDFRVASWNDLKPSLTAWSDDHWNDWRGNPRHERGIARALEAGLGRKLGLRKHQGGVVAGDTRIRERETPAANGAAKPGASHVTNKAAKDEKHAARQAGKSKVHGKSKGARKNHVKPSHRGRSKGSNHLRRNSSGNNLGSSHSAARLGHKPSQGHGSSKLRSSGHGHAPDSESAKGHSVGQGHGRSKGKGK